MPINPGDTFFFDPDGTNQKHLWIVVHVYTPDLCEEVALIVCITSLSPRTTQEHRTCLLAPGDTDRHHFVHQHSYVLYSKIIETESVSLEKQPANTPVCAALLSRIRRGLHASPLTKRRFKTLIPHQ